MGIIATLKQAFYFPVASYFKFFATIRLRMWGPRVIVITGSSGKTTTMHFIKSQLNEKARYSEKANSAFGIPFDILGLRRMTLLPSEWPLLFLKAPLMVFKKPYKETLYVVEADCDRPGEGKFLAQLLKPEVTIWLSLSRSHTANFESEGGNVEKVIAKEFGEFVKSTTGLVIINADNPFIVDASEQTKNVKSVSKKNMTKYEVKEDATAFTINSVTYRIPYLLPEETSYSIQSLTIVMEYLGLEVNTSFSHLILPPGRSSLFEGIKRTKIIDSSYNASLESVSAMLNLFKMYPTDKKWVVVGDMIEQGKYEKEEHEKLADLILPIELEKIVLVGPRVSQYTYPKLVKHAGTHNIVHFDLPVDALSFILSNIKGGETILFKGARFLEGVIGHLLKDKKDIEKLCRRERVWEERRKQWGL